MIPIVSRTVAVCVFRFVSSRAEYLLLKRAPGERLYPDLWQLVTGEVEESETARDAAMREVREETGCVPLHLWVVPETTSFFDPVRNEVNLCPVFCVQVSGDALVQLSEEHAMFEWLPERDAVRRAVWQSHRAILQMVEEYIVSGQEAAGRLKMPLP
jgi:dihydroneopterin triphosphate diphosphatase